MGDKLKESVEALKKYASDIGYWPPESEWNQHAKKKKLYVGQTIRLKTEKSWERLRKEFGFKPKNKTFSKEDCIRALKNAAEVYGPKLKRKEYEVWRKTQEDVPSPAQISLQFRSFTNAKIAAGLIPNQIIGKTFSNDEIANALKACAKEKGILFSDSEYEEWRAGRKDIPTIETVRKRLGSLVEAKRKLGLKGYIPGTNLREYKENEWKSYFYDFVEHALSQESYKKWAAVNNAPSASVLYRHAGGHTEALLKILPIYIKELKNSP